MKKDHPYSSKVESVAPAKKTKLIDRKEASDMLLVFRSSSHHYHHIICSSRICLVPFIKCRKVFNTSHACRNHKILQILLLCSSFVQKKKAAFGPDFTLFLQNLKGFRRVNANGIIRDVLKGRKAVFGFKFELRYALPIAFTGVN